jgi:hypothetical protein
MKLVDWYTREDFGKELIITLLKTKSYSFIQLSLDWNDYGGGPYFQLCSGNHRLLDIIFTIGRFGIALEILGPTWNRNYIND